MEFGLSKEQLLLQESVGKYLARSAPLERVRRFVDHSEARALDVWSGLCELDVPAMISPEDHGGLALSLLDAVLYSDIQCASVAQ